MKKIALLCVLLSFCSLLLLPRAKKTIIHTSRNRKCMLSEVDFKTGDLLLFQSSSIVNFTSNSEITHVGLVVVDNSNNLFIFETTPALKYPKFTPLLTRVYDTIENEGVVIYRSISCPISLKKIAQFFLQNREKKYTHSHLSMMFCNLVNRLSLFLPIRPPERNMFCSTLVAKLLVECNVLPDIERSKNMFPWDFVENRLQTLDSFSYGSEVQLTVIL